MPQNDVQMQFAMPQMMPHAGPMELMQQQVVTQQVPQQLQQMPQPQISQQQIPQQQTPPEQMPQQQMPQLEMPQQQMLQQMMHQMAAPFPSKTQPASGDYDGGNGAAGVQWNGGSGTGEPSTAM